MKKKLFRLVVGKAAKCLNYGSLLMDFLYFFGNVFDPRQMRISVQGSGVYINRVQGYSIDPIYIFDPLFPANNAGRNCFRIHQCIKIENSLLDLPFLDPRVWNDYGLCSKLVSKLTGRLDMSSKSVLTGDLVSEAFKCALFLIFADPILSLFFFSYYGWLPLLIQANGEVIWISSNILHYCTFRSSQCACTERLMLSRIILAFLLIQDAITREEIQHVVSI